MFEFLVITILTLLVIILLRKVQLLSKAVDDLKFDKKSLSVKYGKMSEQFFPLMKDYPFNPQNFRFLGTPIDGVQFEKDKIIFLEFKTSNSQLSAKQKEIQDLVKNKSVDFKEMRISSNSNSVE